MAAVKIIFQPFAPNDATASRSFWPGYLEYDKDGIEDGFTDNTPEGAIIQAPRVRTVNLFRPWKAYYKAQKCSTKSRIPTTYTGTGAGAPANSNLAGQWHETQLTTADSGMPNGNHLTFRTYNLSPGVNYGRFIITGYFVFRDRIT